MLYNSILLKIHIKTKLPRNNNYCHLSYSTLFLNLIILRLYLHDYIVLSYSITHGEIIILGTRFITYTLSQVRSFIVYSRYILLIWM